MTKDEPRPQRAFPRLPLRQQMLITGADAQLHKKTTLTSNMGLGGCAFQFDEALPEGARLRLFLALDARVVKIAARVVYSRPLEAGGYEVGVRFLDISPEDRGEITRLFEKGSIRTLVHPSRQLSRQVVDLVKKYRESAPDFTLDECVDALRLAAQMLTDEEESED